VSESVTLAVAPSAPAAQREDEFSVSASGAGGLVRKKPAAEGESAALPVAPARARAASELARFGKVDAAPVVAGTGPAGVMPRLVWPCPSWAPVWPKETAVRRHPRVVEAMKWREGMAEILAIELGIAVA
jgi:hypothetical protein